MDIHQIYKRRAPLLIKAIQEDIEAKRKEIAELEIELNELMEFAGINESAISRPMFFKELILKPSNEKLETGWKTLIQDVLKRSLIPLSSREILIELLKNPSVQAKGEKTAMRSITSTLSQNSSVGGVFKKVHDHESGKLLYDIVEEKNSEY